MKTRTIYLSVAVMTLLGAIWLSGPAFTRWRASRAAFAQAQSVWLRFQATNSAWLDPQPPAFYYETVLQRKESDLIRGTEYWVDSDVLRTWCTPEKNLRFLEEHLAMPATNYHFTEHRYFHGRGGRVSLKPSAFKSDLGIAQSLAGRTGAGFLSFLHLASRYGLPPTATVQSGSGKSFLISVTDLHRLGRAWQRDFGAHPAYGLHPAVFGSWIECFPNSVEVQVDAQSLLPTALEEKDAQGRIEARVAFDQPWLNLGGQPVPRVILCELPRQGFSLSYEFKVEQGIWLLKEFVLTYPSGYSLCRRSSTRALQVGALADDLFPDPADLEIPEHSVTSLGPGDQVLTVRAADGLPLEAKLSLPPAAVAPAPVVFFLPGSGPWSFDRPLVYPDLQARQEMGFQMKVSNYCDFYARELGGRGIGFFRMNKRGCGIVRDEQGYPREVVNRSLFARTTPATLLADYRAGLQVLRRQPGVDPNRIILLGGSEGTRLAPRLALAEPSGIAAIALLGYSEDGMRDTIYWQHTVGPWRNIAKIFDANNDQKVTRQEYDEVVRLKGKIVAETLPFENLDRNHDGIVTPAEMNQPAAAEAIFKAVRLKDEDFLFDHVVCLSSAHLLEEWEVPPTHKTLLRLDLPLGIFHGENDGSCRVEGVRETAAAFAKAGKTNLTVHTYPKADHDLNWATFLKEGKVPAAYNDVFAFISAHAASKPAAHRDGNK